MIRYLVKNNFKIMCRSITNIVLYILAPTIVAAVLISAFSTLMESYKGVDSFSVGYRLEDDSEFSSYIDQLSEKCKEKGISFIEYKAGDPKTLIAEHSLGGFVEFGKNEYTIYENEDEKAEGQVLEYIFANINDAPTDQLTNKAEAKELSVKHPEFIPAVNSTDYYGIIEVIYFGWCAIVCGAGIFISEKKYKLGKRYSICDISYTKQYLAKFIPIVVTVFLGLLICGTILTVFLGVHFGSLLQSVMVVLLMIMAATAMELLIYYITNSMLATIIISFALVWFMGFFGGSFETYMFSAHPEFLKQLSPIYYGNRALVELSCMGKSAYVVKSGIVSGVIFAVCSALSIGVAKMRREKV